MKEIFGIELWKIGSFIGFLLTLLSIYWLIIQFRDRRKEKKAKQIRDSAEIKNVFEDFEKWLNDEYIFDEESFEKKEVMGGKRKCFSFPASLSEFKDIQDKYLLVGEDKSKKPERIIYVEQEKYDSYQREKAEKYRVSINEKWEQLERNLNRVGYKSLIDIKFLNKVDKKSLGAIENLKNRALSVNDEILRKRN